MIFCGLAVCASSRERVYAAALEHGHVRANTRAFVYRPNSNSVERSGSDASEKNALRGEASEESGSAAGGSLASRRGRGFDKPFLLWREREIDYRARHQGYLAEGPPAGLRFADASPVNRRPPSPALPEFTVQSRAYEPYLIEEPLPEDALNDPALLSEIVVELEPHAVLSGVIETRPPEPEQRIEHFELEERQGAFLRPEEVLIYFESDEGYNRGRAIIPFAPATPSVETQESSARYRKE